MKILIVDDQAHARDSSGFRGRRHSDYLVTPVTAERFDRAMARARHQCDSALPGCGRAASEASPGSLGRTAPVSPRYLVGERQRRLYPLEPKSIDYIEADGNYVTLRAGKVEYLSRDSIKRLSMQLAELGFIRIERSLLVNAAAVLIRRSGGSWDIRLDPEFRCLPAFEPCLSRFDIAHHPAAGLVAPLSRHRVVEPKNSPPSPPQRSMTGLHSATNGTPFATKRTGTRFVELT